MDQVTINIRIKWVLRGLVATALGLIVSSIAVSWLGYYGGHDWLYGFAPKFNVDNEANFPTYFSALLLLFSSILLAIIAAEAPRSSQRFPRHWWALSAMFVLLSVDEMTSLHELLIRPARYFFDVGESLYFVWIVPAAVLVAVFAILFFPFLLQLPAHTRSRLVFAGCVFVGGALGMELAGGYYAYLYGSDNFAYNIIAAIEESMEMGGVILFISALFGVIQSRIASIQLAISG